MERLLLSLEVRGTEAELLLLIKTEERKTVWIGCIDNKSEGLDRTQTQQGKRFSTSKGLGYETRIGLTRSEGFAKSNKKGVY